jgi:hypothetical protein
MRFGDRPATTPPGAARLSPAGPPRIVPGQLPDVDERLVFADALYRAGGLFSTGLEFSIAHLQTPGASTKFVNVTNLDLPISGLYLLAASSISKLETVSNLRPNARIEVGGVGSISFMVFGKIADFHKTVAH